MYKDALRWFSFYTSFYGLFGYWMTPEQEAEFGKLTILSFTYITNISLLVNMISIIITLSDHLKPIRIFAVSFNFCLSFSVAVFYWTLYLFVPNSLNVQKLDPSISLFDDMSMHGIPHVVSIFEIAWGDYRPSCRVSASVVFALVAYNRFLKYYTDCCNGNWVYPIFIKNDASFRNTFFAFWILIVICYYYFILWVLSKEIVIPVKVKPGENDK